MLNDLSSPRAYLASRRSAKPRDMIAPGPDGEDLRTLLTMALRTPDHGKIAPWRVIVIAPDQRNAFANVLADAYRAEKPGASDGEIEAMRTFAHNGPTLLAVLSSPDRARHIPVWEQELSAGALCMNIEHAAHVLGYVACWLTGWPAFSDAVRGALGGDAGERIAGFICIGTAKQPPEERPRPDYDAIVRRWTPPAG